MVRIISLSVLLVLIVFLGGMFFQVVAPFILPLLLAAITAVLCQPLFRYFLRRTGQRVMLAAGMTTTVVLLAILVPIAVGTILAAAQLYVISQEALTQPAWDQSIEWIKHEMEFDSLYARAEPHLLPMFYPDRYEQPEFESTAKNSSAETAGEGETLTSTTVGKQLADETANEQIVSEPSRGDSARTDDLPVEAWKPGDRIPANLSPTVKQSYAELTRHVARTEAIKQMDLKIAELKEQLRANMQGALLSLSQRTLNLAGEVAGTTVNTTLGILGAIIAGLIGFIMFSIALFFFLADGPAMLAATQEMIPVHGEYQRELWYKFDSVIRAVVLATFLSAIGQGLLTAIALYIAGFKHFFILWLLATGMSLIPLAGNWLVWGPCAAWMAYQGEWWTATWLTLFGILVISTIDNVIRTYVLQSDAKLHPLLALVSVLGGLQVMGLAGIFVAPVVASCLHALVKIFNAELKAFSRLKFGAQGETESSALLDAEFDSPETDESAFEDAVSETISETQTPNSAHAKSSTANNTSVAKPVKNHPHPTVKQGKTHRRRKK
ncbi:MAG: AI-2E family transporter [Planctomycetaceae bacterium]